MDDEGNSEKLFNIQNGLFLLLNVEPTFDDATPVNRIAFALTVEFNFGVIIKCLLT